MEGLVEGLVGTMPDSLDQADQEDQEASADLEAMAALAEAAVEVMEEAISVGGEVRHFPGPAELTAEGHQAPEDQAVVG